MQLIRIMPVYPIWASTDTWIYTSFATNDICKRRDATKTRPTWQELGAHIHQGDQAQEKLRKEKETLEATEQQRPIDPMVGMMFQDFFSKKKLGDVFVFFPFQRFLVRRSWMCFCSFSSFLFVFKSNHSLPFPSTFSCCFLSYVREFLGGVAESRPRTFSEAQLWTWWTTQDVILEMLGKLGVLKICLLSCKIHPLPDFFPCLNPV